MEHRLTSYEIADRVTDLMLGKEVTVEHHPDAIQMVAFAVEWGLGEVTYEKTFDGSYKVYVKE